MKIILTFLFAFAIAQLCWSQTVYTLTGTVDDAESHEALTGATVRIPGTRFGANTDEEGHYSISLQTIPQQVVCSFIGYVADTTKDLTSSCLLHKPHFKWILALTRLKVAQSSWSPPPCRLPRMGRHAKK